MFYVYEWFIVATDEVIYVGKGAKNRYKQKKKNKFLNRILESEKCDVRILSYYETELEAFEVERKRINQLKSIGQAICNKLICSTGGCSYIWTNEKRLERSINNPMKCPKQRERMSQLNPMKNKEVAYRVGLAHRKPIFIGEKNFSYAKDAAEYFKVSKSTISDWVRKGHNSAGAKCGYLKHDVIHPQISISKEELTHTIIFDGKEFNTTTEAAKYANVQNRTILRWCKQGFSSTGIPCRFKDDIKEYTYQKPNKSHGKPIVVNGVWYKNMKEATSKTGISEYLLRKYYRGHKHDNQHPSQGNFDNSTLEGSETNG